MPNVISALTARTQFGRIMKLATENDERFMVDKRGQPQVIIMSVKDYIKTIAPPPKVLQEIWAESRRKGTDTLTMRQINAEIATYRGEKRKNRAMAQADK